MARPDYQVAVHEAGHVSVCAELMIPFTGVSIFSASNPKARGQVVTDEAGSSPRALAVMVAAGPLAEIKAAGWSPDWSAEGRDWTDFCAFCTTVARRSRRTAKDVAAELEERARRHVEDCWPLIHGLATALVQRRYLTRAEVGDVWERLGN